MSGNNPQPVFKDFYSLAKKYHLIQDISYIYIPNPLVCNNLTLSYLFFVA